ncbi:hypothetical protein HD806DRAFT_518208 [Xylariaceae sp. AK1471]|nr:hypothetical protein HD806DRAFT_518208 [Xylariaceae sp. AK1471]
MTTMREGYPQRFSHPTRPPPAFWDNLSKIPLIRSALRELDRRNLENLSYSYRHSQAIAPENISKCIQPATSTQRYGQHAPKKGCETRRSRPNGFTRYSTKSTNPYNRAFRQHLIDYRICPDGYKYPNGKTPPQPDNLSDISKQANADAFEEDEVMSSVIPIIEGYVEDGKGVSGGVRFTNLDHFTDGSLVRGNPDRYYGARPEQLDQRVRAELSGHIVPSTQHNLPIVPNFFLAAKGPDGSLAVAEQQACYDGALGARGFRSLHLYSEAERAPDNKAYTITCIYHGDQLKMYTSHFILPSRPGGSWECIMTQIKAYALTGDVETFRARAAAYRNARDWAKQKRDKAIGKANEKAAQDRLDA